MDFTVVYTSNTPFYKIPFRQNLRYQFAMQKLNLARVPLATVIGWALRFPYLKALADSILNVALRLFLLWSPG